MASTIKRKINEGITQVKNAASFIITDVTSHWSKPGKGNYVSYKEILNYSIGGMGQNMLIYLLGYMALGVTNTLFASTIGIRPMHLQNMLTVQTILNIVFQIIRGKIVDNTNTRWGRFRPYLAIMGAPLAIISVIFVFLPFESMSYSDKYTAVFVFAIAISIGQPLYQTAYTNLGSVISPSTAERSKVLAISSLIYSFAPTVYQLFVPIFSNLTGGFTDINPSGAVKNFISGAAITNELYGKGFYIAQLRTRYKGYSDNIRFGSGAGAWFAFWLHGPVHEFDLMEQTVGAPRVINYVNQYHNGWSNTYGSTYMSRFYQILTVSGDDTVMQDNWYSLALQWTDDQVTYYYNKDWVHYFRANNDNTQASLVKNNSLSGASTVNGNNNQNVNTSGWSTTYNQYGYNGRLTVVPLAPMNVFLSTEIGPGWGNVPAANSINYLPVWVEADYIAYYVPEGSSEASN